MIRDTMDNLLNILSLFNTEHEKALTHSIYNAVAFSILCLIFAASYGLYIILSPFVKPLIWALLCGSVLFPFKLSMTTMLQSWFTMIESSHKPILVNLLMVPLHVTDHCSEIIGSLIWRLKWQNIKYILAFFILGMTLSAMYTYSPGIISCMIWKIFSIMNSITEFFVSTCNFYMLSAVVLGYLCVLYIYWTPENAIHFRYLSFVIWFIISLYVSNALGIYPVIMFFAIQVLFIMGFIYEVVLILEHVEINQVSFKDIICYALSNDDISLIYDDNQKEKSMMEESENKETNEGSSSVMEQDVKTLPQEKVKPLLLKSASIDANADKWYMYHLSGDSKFPANYIRANKRSPISDRNFLKKIRAEFRGTLDIEDDKVDTSRYMYGALYLCTGMLLWKHKWMIHMLMLPIGYYFLKKAGSYFGVWDVIRNHIYKFIEAIRIWCTTRHQALIPVNVRGLYKVSIIINQKFTQILKGSIDAVSTIAVIFGLLIFTTCTSMFITFQVYGEGLHLLQVTGQLLNTTLMNNPDIDWLPKQWEDSINNVLDNAYMHGRDAISNGMKGLMKDFEQAKAEHLEKKVLELWDRLYQAWMMSNENSDLIGPTVDANAAFSVWESVQDSFEKIPNNFLNFTNIKNFAQENVGILAQIVDSVWSIIKGNASIILSIITESLYIILMSGSLVFNFILSMIVFFTALFYLLSSSGKTYKPVELVTSYSPISCHRFAIALQEAVIGVFTATFKLASFFGMWTWFVHNLFQVKIVYLPSAFATLLGAVPFLDAYFACIPATIELWLTQGPMIAVLFFMFHFLPCNIVVTDFYKEIKGGGHPYLTGLSIAGGIFCLGVEGVIFGPLLLCCIIVAINLSRRYLHSPSEETLNNLQSQLKQYRSN